MSRNCRTLFVLLVLAVFTNGCGDQKKPSPAARPDPNFSAQLPASSAAELFARDPATVLVSVDGKEYTLAQARDDIDMRMRAALARQPGADEAQLRKTLLGQVVDQFVLRTLLLNEADRREIELSEADEATAFDRIRAQLPPDKTLEEVMESSPMGAERMRSEVLTGLRINKLFEQVLPKSEPVADAEIAAFMEQNPDAKMPETVSASHILIKTSETDTAEQKAAKLAEIKALHARLAAGEDFAQLAREHSQCPSAQKGGMLGTFRKGQMVKPFEDAAFSQQPGAIGDIVHTSFGYHIIRVDAHNQAGDVPRDMIAKRIQQGKAKAAYDQFLLQLRAKADIQYPATEW